MNKYFTTIGLEIHAELRTETKMFCQSKNDPEEKSPNTNICPICMGFPGTLPVINKEAVRHVLRLGAAVGGKLADYTEFDRKNYFYPDIPKGYQISQYKFPLVSGGVLNGVNLTRVHLEEDTARSSHESGEYSLVDFNRAGVPLMELVTEPVIKSAEEASQFARELQLLLICLGASNANMEKGEMRVEANISVSSDPNKFGTKVEVKNLNSFKAVEKAIRFEVDRHIALLESGESIKQETRGWDETREETFSQRAKEDSHDYRYFPDPDLPKLFVSEIPEFSEEALKNALPELPWEKRERLTKMGIKSEHVEVYLSDTSRGGYFDKVSEALEDRALLISASNFLNIDPSISELTASNVDVKNFIKLVSMYNSGKLSSTGAKAVLQKMTVEESKDPEAIAVKNNLIQTNAAEALNKVVEEIISANPKAVTEYKNGKTASLQFLIGMGMKATKGSANPEILKQAFEKNLAK